MATVIGFKRGTYFIYDEDDKVVKTHVVEGKANKGGMVEATISGLSAEPVKVYASNIAYYVAQKGTGSVEASISVLDMTQELQSDLLGRVENEDGIVFIGSETQPPYAGVLLESNALSGEPVFFALLKGKFALDEQTMSTNEEEQAEPEAEEMTGSFVADANGNTVATAKGEDKRAKMEALFQNINKGTTTTTTTTTP